MSIVNYPASVQRPSNQIVRKCHVTGRCIFIGTGQLGLKKMGEDERLIEEVRVFERLWKVNSNVYKDRRAQFL